MSITVIKGFTNTIFTGERHNTAWTKMATERVRKHDSKPLMEDEEGD